MKYKEIYDAISSSGCTNVEDRSYWHLPKMDSVQKCYPLLIVMDSPRTNLRVRVRHELGVYGIVTAELGLRSDIDKYCKSMRRYIFQTQKEMADGLFEILGGAA
jgi:hypothetical protein